jgi:hypothetical protein
MRALLDRTFPCNVETKEIHLHVAVCAWASASTFTSKVCRRVPWVDELSQGFDMRDGLRFNPLFDDPP